MALKLPVTYVISRKLLSTLKIPATSIGPEGTGGRVHSASFYLVVPKAQGPGAAPPQPLWDMWTILCPGTWALPAGSSGSGPALGSAENGLPPAS